MSQEGTMTTGGSDNDYSEDNSVTESWEQRNDFAKEHELSWAIPYYDSSGGVLPSNASTPSLVQSNEAIMEFSKEESCYEAILLKLNDCSVDPERLYDIEGCEEMDQSTMETWERRSENAAKAGALMQKMKECYVPNQSMQMDIISTIKPADTTTTHQKPSCQSIHGYNENCNAKCDKRNSEQYESKSGNENPSICADKCDHQMECIGFYWNSDGTCKYFRGNGALLAGEASDTAICYSKDAEHKKQIEEKHNKIKHLAEANKRKQDAEQSHKKERMEKRKEEKLQRLQERKEAEDIERGEEIHAIKQIQHQLDSVSETVTDRLSVAQNKLDKIKDDIDAKRTSGVPNTKSTTPANTLLSF